MVVLLIILTDSLLIPIIRNVRVLITRHWYIPELSLLKIQALFMLL